MARTSRRGEPAVEPRRTSRWWIAIPVVLAITVAGFFWLRDAPPPLDADPEVRTTVDALFTAVNARHAQNLADCERRLRSQRESGRLSGESAEYLDEVIAQARAGQWESAARRLYQFVQPR